MGEIADQWEALAEEADMASDEYYDVTATYKAQSPKAVLLSIDDYEFWCPKSCMHIASERACDEASRGEEVELRIRGWKLEEEGIM